MAEDGGGLDPKKAAQNALRDVQRLAVSLLVIALILNIAVPVIMHYLVFIVLVIVVVYVVRALWNRGTKL